MNPITALKNLVNGSKSESDINTVAQAVAATSKRGEYYDGQNSTSITDWITEGDFDGSDTIKSLAKEWDQ